jgi:fatty acid desaturase
MEGMVAQDNRLGEAVLFPRSHYAGILKTELPEASFAPARSRMLRVPVHLAIAVMGIVALGLHWLPWFLMPVASLAIGTSFACLTFVAHEALHGGIVKNKRVQYLLGWFGFVPFLVSPRLWMAWHNRDHHANTNMPDDPDAYPTLEKYRARATTRFAADTFSLGGRRWRGILSLILGFTVQSADQLFSSHALSPRERRLAMAESAFAVVMWGTLAALIGFVPFVFAYVVPVLLANACVMAFILTNHSLSPRLTINDPLVGSLSVTTSRAVEWLTLGFGYHVEHHLFPAMSTRHGPAVRDLVRAHWPGRYQSMPLVTALGQLHRTARVYKDATTLIDPTTGREYPTLMPA